jgi:hypothetical protein
MVFLELLYHCEFVFNLQVSVLRDEYIRVYAINGDEVHKSKS